VEYDPGQLIVATYWEDPTGQTPALPTPIPTGEVGAALLESSQAGLLRIAINGGDCVPDVHLSVLQGPPDVELEITIRKPILEPGRMCGLVLTTHAFDVELSGPEEVREVVLSVVRQ